MFKSSNPSLYDKEALKRGNIMKYLKDEYGATGFTKTVQIEGVEPLLQRNYGGDNDCTLVSIVTALHKNVKEQPKAIYKVVEPIATSYGYDASSGTNPSYVKKIYDECLAHYNLPADTSWGIVKSVGVTINKIDKALKADKPIILNLNSDGRDYYSDHTVTITGYSTAVVKNKTYYFLHICDNWNKMVTYIDWQKLSRMCSINY